MNLIWATRGKTWGFRFLRNGGLDDPLATYETAFAGASEPEICRRVGDTVALRFLDPERRKDRAGRVIAHDFVFAGPLAREVTSVAAGVRLVWPQVADEYARVWDASSPS